MIMWYTSKLELVLLQNSDSGEPGLRKILFQYFEKQQNFNYDCV